MKILIVDDSLAMRHIIRRSLRQAGFEKHDIVEAADGKAALDIVKAESPNLILSDWNMPKMSGIDFLKALRADGDHTPLGFITTESTEKMRQLATDAGAGFLLAKPFSADDIKRELSPYLG